ncbi:putative quinol monooxygenase [Alcanivorax sp. DP30]|uniref:putative quinol monooxygenase n=1 Tax=Alcanivorax sp. DP30 TaxID=2606217 RepID=UPI00136A4F19|nr:putative quinol monooxygenase [Alcanivorax sp. DP30]MZR62243.1 antibiotic biosynthesis monooxygenase [Alcanivorax sp. DP30]
MDVNVAVFGFLRFPPGSIPAIRPFLDEFVRATKIHDGCIAYDVAEDLNEPGLLRFSELWPDRRSLDAHLSAPHITPWREAAREHGLLERHFIAYDVSGARTV